MSGYSRSWWWGLVKLEITLVKSAAGNVAGLGWSGASI